jgi:hypothetical protein
VHAVLAIGNGNVIELDVPDRIVNCGVVNITVLELPQFLPSGPLNVNCTFTFCGALRQSATLAVTLMKDPRLTVAGLTVTPA